MSQPLAAASLASHPPVSLSLAAAAGELDLIAGWVETLQVTLSPLMRAGVAAIEGGQALDEITQHLRELGEFLAAIAMNCPETWSLDADSAAAGLRLQSQKLRLTAASPLPRDQVPLPHGSSGELELW